MKQKQKRCNRTAGLCYCFSICKNSFSHDAAHLTFRSYSLFTDLTNHLSDILEQQKIEAVKAKDVSEEEKARQAAILAAYSAVDSGNEYPLAQILTLHVS